MIDFADLSHQRFLDVARIPDELLPLLQQDDPEAAKKWLMDYAQHPGVQPHKVTLYVLENQFATSLRAVTYFIRCARHSEEMFDGLNPHQRAQAAQAAAELGLPMPAASDAHIAAVLADALWRAWEKPKPVGDQLPSAWPDTVDVADVVEIDEGDWMEYLTAAHRHGDSSTQNGNYFCVGHPRFPLYWTCTALPFEDDIDVHELPGTELLDMWAGDPTRNTRGEVVE